MSYLWRGFFWGAPSHKRIAWVGAVAGLLVIALATDVAVIGKGKPVFTLAVLLVGLSESGWAAELLPRRWAVAAGWGRMARWLCALGGVALIISSALTGAISFLPLGVGVAAGAVLLAFEMAPTGPANRP